jgi:hypothetical protein
MDRENALSVVKTWLPGPNTLAKSPNEAGKVAGFWLGLLHGGIAPITFIVSLFRQDVHVYEVHNNGAWYNLGFLLGLMGSLGGSRGGAMRPRTPCSTDLNLAQNKRQIIGGQG